MVERGEGEIVADDDSVDKSVWHMNATSDDDIAPASRFVAW